MRITVNIVIFFSLVFFSLTSQSQRFVVPKIFDTLPKTEVLKRSSAINIAYPHIDAIEPFSASVNLSQSKYNLWDLSLNRNVEQRADGLQLLVDTTQFVTLTYNKDYDFYKSDDTTQKYFKGLPCFIYNESSQDKWLYIQDSKIIVIQEAFDSNYNWRPIQIWNWSWCGNSYYRACIKSNHFLLFKVPLYEGKYYTDLRLKLYSKDAIYYSNSYKGWISYKQFDLPKSLMGKKGKPGFNLSFLNVD